MPRGKLSSQTIDTPATEEEKAWWAKQVPGQVMKFAVNAPSTGCTTLSPYTPDPPLQVACLLCLQSLTRQWKFHAVCCRCKNMKSIGFGCGIKDFDSIQGLRNQKRYFCSRARCLVQQGSGTRAALMPQDGKNWLQLQKGKPRDILWLSDSRDRTPKCPADPTRVSPTRQRQPQPASLSSSASGLPGSTRRVHGSPPNLPLQQGRARGWRQPSPGTMPSQLGPSSRLTAVSPSRPGQLDTGRTPLQEAQQPFLQAARVPAAGHQLTAEDDCSAHSRGPGATAPVQK